MPTKKKKIKLIETSSLVINSPTDKFRNKIFVYPQFLKIVHRSISATIHNGILLNTVTEVSPHDPEVWVAVCTGVISESKTSREPILTDSHLQSLLLQVIQYR